MTEDTTRAVCRIIRETLALPAERSVSPEDLLFYDLGFSSLDLVDLLFRIEAELGVHVDERTIYESARGELADEEFSSGGVLTAAGRQRVMALLSDSPATLFPETLEARALPRYCSVAALVRLIESKRAEPGEGASPA